MRLRRRHFAVSLTMLLFASGLALGQSAPQSGPSNLLDVYKNATTQWINVGFNAANWIFGVLAVIELAWTGMILALERNELSGWLAGYLKKFFTIGIFYAILLKSSIWMPAIIGGFTSLGAKAGNVSGFLNPSDVLLTGCSIAGNLLKAAVPSAIVGAFFAPLALPSILVAFCALVIFFAYVVITLTLIMATVESYVVLSAGVIFLGFGAARWTVNYTERYFSLVVSTGVRLMVIYMIVGLGQSLSTQWISAAQQFPISLSGIQALLGLVASVIVYMALAWQVPKLASSLLGGSLQMGSSDLVAPAMTAGVAAGTIAATAAAIAAAIPTGGASVAAGAGAAGTAGAAGAAGTGGSFAAAGTGAGAAGTGSSFAAAGTGQAGGAGVDVAAPKIADAGNTAASSSKDVSAPKIDSEGGSSVQQADSTTGTVGGNGESTATSGVQSGSEVAGAESVGSQAGIVGDTVAPGGTAINPAAESGKRSGAETSNTAAPQSSASNPQVGSASDAPTNQAGGSEMSAPDPNVAEAKSAGGGEQRAAEGKAQSDSRERKKSLGEKVSSMHNTAATVKQNMPDDSANISAPSMNIHHGE